MHISENDLLPTAVLLEITPNFPNGISGFPGRERVREEFGEEREDLCFRSGSPGSEVMALLPIHSLCDVKLYSPGTCYLKTQKGVFYCQELS